MKSIFSFSTYFLLLIFSLHAEAETIHVIKVSDTQDRTIGTGAVGNSQKLSTLMLDVSSLLSIRLNEVNISGALFSCDSIRKAVSSLDVKPDDVVIFFYSGHGFRKADSASKYPLFYCGSEVYVSDAPGLESVVAQISNKTPRLILAIADTCNLVISEPAIPRPAFQFSGKPSQRAAAYKQLFQRYKGILLISSSRPKQASWYMPDAGLFSTQFFQAIDDETVFGNAGKWENIVLRASNEIVVQTQTGPEIRQNPQYNIDRLKASP